MRCLNFLLFNFLVLSCSSNPDSGKPTLKGFFGSLNFDGRFILVIDMDKCASCHYKQFLELCQLDCPNILLLIHSTNHAKNRILSRDCKNAITGQANVSFFSDRKIMETIALAREGSSLFLVSKQPDDEVSIRQIVQINEVDTHCH